MSVLHQEITDRIIDFVREVSSGHFRAPLKSCALVSKAWVTRSQRHLFHHVKLQYETELRRWCKNITKERAKVLSTYVKWLSYSPPYKTKDQDVLDRFTRVETLSIVKADFREFSDEKSKLRSTFCHFGNSTLYIVLDRCIGHFPTVINLFRLFPKFTHLDLHDCTLPYPTLMSEEMFGDFDTVEMLRVTASERGFLDMLMPERFTALKHISYFDKGPESPGDFRLLLRCCGKTVETLTVLSGHSLTISEFSFVTPFAPMWYISYGQLHSTFLEAFDRKGFPEEYSLDYCKNLRKIAFDHVHANKPSPEILAVLPTVDPAHFETVTFLSQNANINLDSPSDKYWRKIDYVLAALGQDVMEKHSRELEVVFDGWRAPIEDEGARERWVGLLPNFSQVGKIRFKYMDPPPHVYDPPTWHSLTREVVKGPSSSVL